jgi:diguanylate cyclase (GGDEF)-like protein/PAS domain S-box-containing protein
VINLSIVEFFLLILAIASVTFAVLRWKKSIYQNHAEVVRSHRVVVDQKTQELAFSDTQKMQLAQSMQQTEARLRLLLDSAAEGIYGLDLKGRFTFVNKAALRMLGYQTEAELLGSSAHHTIHHTKPDGSPYSSLESGMFRAQQDGHELHENVDVLWTKPGSALPVELWFYPIYEAAEITGSVVTFIDISEALKREAQHTASVKKFEHLMNNSPDAILVSDFSGVLQYVNQAASELLGYKHDELLGKSFFSLIPATRRVQDQQQFYLLIQGNNQTKVESRLMHKDGHVIALETSANCVLEDGLVYGNFRDITQRKANQKRIKNLLERFSLATQAAQLSVVDFDVVNDAMYLDERACALHNLPLNDETKLSYAEFKHTLYPDDAVMLDAIYEQAKIATQEDYQLNFRVQSSTGVVRNIEAFVKVTRNEQHHAVRMLGVGRDITQQKIDEYEIHLLAFYDALTKLPNRRLLMDNLKHALAMSEHSRSYGAVLFLDLDHFKKLNDTRGHDVGDLLLLEVAQRLRGCLRESDTVGRLGGDEFVVILEALSTSEELAMHQAELVAEKVIQLLARPYQFDDFVHQTSTSMGVSLFLGHQKSADDLLKHTDSAMYQAKAAGRGMFYFYDADVQHKIEQRSILESDLRLAVERSDELQLYYQVQVDVQARVLGAEILLRWQHPTLGMLYPAQFIELAEETALIVPIGDWILKRALLQLKIWQADPLMQHLQLAVNVSEKQFGRVDFVDKLKRLLQFSGANPALLKLELTEGSMLQDIDSVIEKMQQVKNFGVKFSLDDFGTGYSSLSYLKKLPLDQIKIDQSFVRDISTDVNDAAIVEMIIAMSKSLRLDVIAEGVETVEQRDYLLAHGCQSYQGYLYGEPVCLEEFLDLVKAYSSGRLAFMMGGATDSVGASQHAIAAQ